MEVPSEEEFLQGVRAFERHEKRDAMYQVARFLVDYFWKRKDFQRMADGLGVLLLTWNQAFYRYGGFDFYSLEECIKENRSRIAAFRKRHILNLQDSDRNDIEKLFNSFLVALQNDEIRFSDQYKRKYTVEGLLQLLRQLGIERKYSGSLKVLYDSIEDNPKIGDAVHFIDKTKAPSKKNYIVIYVSELGNIEREVVESSGMIKRSPVSVAKALHALTPRVFPMWDTSIAPKYVRDYRTNPARKYLLFCRNIKAFAEKAKDYTTQDNKTVVKLIDEYNYAKYTKGWI